MDLCSGIEQEIRKRWGQQWVIVPGWGQCLGFPSLLWQCWLASRPSMWPERMCGHACFYKTCYDAYNTTIKWRTLMAALWNRAGCYIFVLWFLFSFFPHLYLAVTYWMSTTFQTWCGLSANVKCRSEMCCTRLTEIQDTNNRQKFAICSPPHNFVGLCLRN